MNEKVIELEKKKVVLVGLYLPGIYPPGKDEVVSGLLSNAFLKATAEADPEIKSRYSFDIIDIPTTIEACEIAEKICNLKPDILAYSVYMWNYTQMAESLVLVKDTFPEIKVLLGGPLVTYTPEDMLQKNPLVDVIVCGSGESRFKQLLKNNLDVEMLESIPRIAYRDENRQICLTEGDVQEDLNNIPLPYHNKAVDLNDGRKHTVIVETYRGCVFECGYCIWGEPDKSLYKFPIDGVLNEIDEIYNNPNVEAVIFADACLFYTRERAKQIIDKIVASSEGNRIPTVLTLDILVINEEMVQSLSKLNMIHGQLHFGMQTTNPKALELLKRKSGPDVFKKRIEQIRQVDPAAQISFDLIYGLPGDNYEAFRESVNFAMSMDPGKLYFSPLLLLPGTPFWDQKEELGFDYDPLPPYMVRSNKHYSPEDMEKTFRLVLWLLTIMYVPAIRDAIVKIPSYNSAFRSIELVDRYIEILRESIDPVSECECIFTIDNNNDSRRHVMNVISRPENILLAYEATQQLLSECDAEILSEDIKIGIDYYRTICVRENIGDSDFYDQYDRKKIDYIKTSWVTA
tara:strand:+ start:3962 stop:5677 length:1716 start_codon:yes stop_codon:yes gene_type:complete